MDNSSDNKSTLQAEMIVINESPTRMIRAGGYNGLLLMVPAWIMLSIMIARSDALNTVVATTLVFLFGLIGPLLMIRRYLSFVSRLVIDDKGIHLVCPLTTVSIPLHEIDYVSLKKRTLEGIVIVIKEKRKRFSRRFLLIIAWYKAGSPTEVLPRLEKMLSNKQIRIA